MAGRQFAPRTPRPAEDGGRRRWPSSPLGAAGRCLAVTARTSTEGEPTAAVGTALDAVAASEVIVTTDRVFGQEDIYKFWKAVPSGSVPAPRKSCRST